MMQSFILMAAVSVVWAIVGYSLAFDAGNPFIGGLRFAFLRDVGAGPVRIRPDHPAHHVDGLPAHVRHHHARP